MMKQCEATRKNGEPCAAMAGASGFCFAHDPAKLAERRQARSKGGKARHGRKLDGDQQAAAAPSDLLVLTGDAPLTPEDLAAVLSDKIRKIALMETSHASARSLGYLAGALLKVYEVGELADRLDELEQLISGRTAGGRVH